MQSDWVQKGTSLSATTVSIAPFSPPLSQLFSFGQRAAKRIARSQHIKKAKMPSRFVVESDYAAGVAAALCNVADFVAASWTKQWSAVPSLRDCTPSWSSQDRVAIFLLGASILGVNRMFLYKRAEQVARVFDAETELVKKKV